MRGPSLRKYTLQLWSRMACNSLPDPIPNLLIRCFFFPSPSPSPSFALTFLHNSLKWELAVPLKIHLKPNMSSISFCRRGEYARSAMLSAAGWAEETLGIPLSLSVTTSEISDHSCSIEFVWDRAAWQMRVAVIVDRVSSPGCRSIYTRLRRAKETLRVVSLVCVVKGQLFFCNQR